MSLSNKQLGSLRRLRALRMRQARKVPKGIMRQCWVMEARGVNRLIVHALQERRWYARPKIKYGYRE